MMKDTLSPWLELPLSWYPVSCHLGINSSLYYDISFTCNLICWLRCISPTSILAWSSLSVYINVYMTYPLICFICRRAVTLSPHSDCDTHAPRPDRAPRNNDTSVSGSSNYFDVVYWASRWCHCQWPLSKFTIKPMSNENVFLEII